jgi:hypothetical protein
MNRLRDLLGRQIFRAQALSKGGDRRDKLCRIDRLGEMDLKTGAEGLDAIV